MGADPDGVLQRLVVPGHVAVGVVRVERQDEPLARRVELAGSPVERRQSDALDRRVEPVAGIPIGLCLTLIHLFLIPVTNASVNPARSTGPALFAGGAYISQLWLFWLAPVLGAAIAGVVARWQHEEPTS